MKGLEFEADFFPTFVTKMCYYMQNTHRKHRCSFPVKSEITSELKAKNT